MFVRRHFCRVQMFLHGINVLLHLYYDEEFFSILQILPLEYYTESHHGCQSSPIFLYNMSFVLIDFNSSTNITDKDTCGMY